MTIIIKLICKLNITWQHIICDNTILLCYPHGIIIPRWVRVLKSFQLGISRLMASRWKYRLYPRWWLEEGSRQYEIHKSKILLRYWSNPWQKKNTKKKQHSDPPNPQCIESFSMPHYTEKPGGPWCCQTLAPNLLRRCRQKGEQISGTWYSHSHPWDKPAYLLSHTDLCLTKKPTKKLNNKQGIEKDTKQSGWGALSTPDKRGGARCCFP
jgi:hypothetical protein